MYSNRVLISLFGALMCSVQLAFAQNSYFILGNSGRTRDDSGERRGFLSLLQPSAQRVYAQPSRLERVSSFRHLQQPLIVRQRDDSDESRSYGRDDDAKYQFSYRVRASGDGSDSREGGRGYGGGSKRGGGGASQEFGHTEAREGSRTEGSYFVELPDGRLQRVEYYVDGKSGFVARVTYDGKSASAEN